MTPIPVMILLYAFSARLWAQSFDFRNTQDIHTRAVHIVSSLDDSALAAQVLLTGIDGKTSLAPAMRSLLERIPAGGVMLFGYNLDTSRDAVKNLLAETSLLVAARTGIYPFIAVDHEGGMVHRFGSLARNLPSAYYFWELAQIQGHIMALNTAEKVYLQSAAEIRELGITMVLAPVAETLNEENRFFLGNRSYGPDPDFTRNAASAFIRSMNAAGITCVVKHFPGNTAVDPHDGIPVLKADKTALDEMIKPFTGIIHSLSPQALMLSHVMVPALDSRRNASLSPHVIRDWLRAELGFEGIIIADDFSMAAITASGLDPKDAIVEAFNAGVDMIMTWPRELNSAHSAILEALISGRLSRGRLEEAAGRIITGKLQYDLVSK